MWNKFWNHPLWDWSPLLFVAALLLSGGLSILTVVGAPEQCQYCPVDAAVEKTLPPVTVTPGEIQFEVEDAGVVAPAVCPAGF